MIDLSTEGAGPGDADSSLSATGTRLKTLAWSGIARRITELAQAASLLQNRYPDSVDLKRALSTMAAGIKSDAAQIDEEAARAAAVLLDGFLRE